jgi:hypothetical protein
LTSKKIIPAFYDDRFAYVDLGEPSSQIVKNIRCGLQGILKLNKLEPGQYVFVPENLFKINRIKSAVRRAKKLYKYDFNVITDATHNGVRGTKIQRVDKVFEKNIIVSQ